MRWRTGSSVALFAVGVVTIVAAATGPIYLAAADQSLLASTLARAATIQTGLTLTPVDDVYESPARLETFAHTVPGGYGANVSDAYGSPILTTDSSSSLFNPTSGRPDGIDLMSRTGAAHDLTMVAGHFPVTADQVVLSNRTAKALELHVGSVVRPLGSGRGATPPRLIVAGLYQPGPARPGVWWGLDPFPFGTANGSESELLDFGFVTPAGSVQLSQALRTVDWLQLPLRPAALSAASEPRFASSLSNWERQSITAHHITAATRISSTLAAAVVEEHIAATIVTIETLELVVLCLLVLYAVASATSAVRAPDIRVAALRGLPRRRTASMALAEPTALLVVAFPFGIAASLALCTVVDRHLLGPAERTHLDSLAVFAAIGVLVAGIASVAVASRSLLLGREGVEAVTTRSLRRGRTGALADIVGILLAVAGILGLTGERSSNGANVSAVTYLGPGLIALGAAILGTRILPLVASLLSRSLAWSRRIALTLAARSVARRSSVTRQVLVPAIVTGLAVFAASGSVVADRNHSMQATFTLGAPVVLHVTAAPGTDLVSSVRAADRVPHAPAAMAVGVIEASYGRTLAVDAPELTSVVSWPAGMTRQSLATIATRIDPPTDPAPTIDPGSQLNVRVDAPHAISPAPELSVTLFDPVVGSEDSVTLGNIRAGDNDYSARLFGLCSKTCRVDGIGLAWGGSLSSSHHGSPAEQQAARQRNQLAASFPLVLQSITTSAPAAGSSDPVDDPVYFSRPGEWSAAAGVKATARPAGLAMQIDLPRAIAPEILTPQDAPTRLPAVSTSNGNGTLTPGTVPWVGLDGSVNNARVIAVASVLPVLGDNGDMVDLSLATLQQKNPTLGVEDQVWMRRPPGPAFLRALRRHGVTVTATSVLATGLTALSRTGASFGFDLNALAASIAGLLAFAWLVFSIAADARDRRVEIAGLVAIGVRRRSLVGALLLESTAIALTGAVMGTVAGVVGARLALAFLPEFPPGRVGPPLDLSLPVADALLAGLAVFILLEVVSVVAHVVVARGVKANLLWVSA